MPSPSSTSGYQFRREPYPVPAVSKISSLSSFIPSSIILWNTLPSSVQSAKTVSQINLYPPKGRFLWRISFKFSPKASFDILNNILESGFDFHVSSLGSTNVPMWERWERDDKILPDFENMKKTCSSKAKC